ncbi:hypothetical protein EMCRGX_G020257 [Ephydatia muelleri]
MINSSHKMSNHPATVVSSPDPDSQQLRVDYITATWPLSRSGDVIHRSCWESWSGDETTATEMIQFQKLICSEIPPNPAHYLKASEQPPTPVDLSLIASREHFNRRGFKIAFYEMAAYTSVPVEAAATAVVLDGDDGSKGRKSRMVPSTDADIEVPGYGGCFYILAAVSFIPIILFFPLSLFFTIKIVKEYERAVILRLGRLSSKKAKGPGLFFVLPCTDDVRVVDLRTITFDVQPQEILTKDSVTARVDAVVYFRIVNPTSSIVKVENAYNSTYLLAQTTLRSVLGTKKLGELLSERETISAEMQHHLDEATEPWGVRVERVEVKDVTIPPDMQRSMASEAEAMREARAKVISAEGEQNASRVLREAADIMDESPATLQLRYLQTLHAISAQNNHTYVFPLPVDLLTRLFAGNKS